jgi:hypothetical protein
LLVDRSSGSVCLGLMLGHFKTHRRHIKHLPLFNPAWLDPAQVRRTVRTGSVPLALLPVVAI